MSELRAAPVDFGGFGGLASTVIGGNAPTPTKLCEAARFEDGQLSGPFGPQFVGFGPMPRVPLLQRLRPALLGLGCGLAALGVISATGRM